MADEPHAIPSLTTPPACRIAGEKIRRLREEKGLTQLYVATVVGVTTDTISRWENRRSPSIKPENAKKLAEALEVTLEAILDQSEDANQQENQPEQATSAITPPPAPAPDLRRSVGIGLALLLLLTIAATLFAWWFAARKAMPITAVRFLPPHAPIGLPFPVAITLTPAAGEAVSLIISETMAPEGVALMGMPPFTATSSATRTVKWLAKPAEKTTLFYLARIEPHSPPLTRLPFRGEITSHGGSGAMTPIGGAASIAIAPYHWADTNRDFVIDDEEILAVYDTFGAATTLHLEASMIEEIWSGRGYRWDDARRQLIVLP